MVYKCEKCGFVQSYEMEYCHNCGKNDFIKKYYPIDFIEWLILTSDFKLNMNHRKDFWYERNDVEDINSYTINDVFDWWQININKN